MPHTKALLRPRLPSPGALLSSTRIPRKGPADPPLLPQKRKLQVPEGLLQHQVE